MSYEESGFNEFLVREEPDKESSGWTEDVVATMIPQMSGSGIGSGISKSSDGKLIIDWDKGTIKVNDGVRNRVTFGTMEDNSDIGIKILNSLGDLIFSAGGALQPRGIAAGTLTVALEVGGANVKIDGENGRIIVHDSINNRIVIGNV